MGKPFSCQRPFFPPKWLFPNMAVKPLHHIYIYSNKVKEARVWTQALHLWLQLPVRCPWHAFDPNHPASRQLLSVAGGLAGNSAIPNRKGGILLWSLIVWTWPDGASWFRAKEWVLILVSVQVWKKPVKLCREFSICVSINRIATFLFVWAEDQKVS